MVYIKTHFIRLTHNILLDYKITLFYFLNKNYFKDGYEWDFLPIIILLHFFIIFRLWKHMYVLYLQFNICCNIFYMNLRHLNWVFYCYTFRHSNSVCSYCEMKVTRIYTQFSSVTFINRLIFIFARIYMNKLPWILFFVSKKLN